MNDDVFVYLYLCLCICVCAFVFVYLCICIFVVVSGGVEGFFSRLLPRLLLVIMILEKSKTNPGGIQNISGRNPKSLMQ